MRKRIFPSQYADITSVIDNKREMLTLHRSQKEWLDKSQGIDAYLKAMEEMSREVGRMSGKFKYAEGWRRHSHLGFASAESDPLGAILGSHGRVNRTYETNLERPSSRRT